MGSLDRLYNGITALALQFSFQEKNGGPRHGLSFVFGSSRRIFLKTFSFMMVSSAPESHKKFILVRFMMQVPVIRATISLLNP